MDGDKEVVEEVPTENSIEQLIKHPLQNRWSLWFYKNDKTKDWKENLIQITSVDTVEDFWALYNHIEVASKMPVGCDYSLFKYGIQPMWEDERNKHGGRWLVSLNKQYRASDLDNFWLETLLCMIGEAFDEASEIVCGAVVQVRPKGDKIGIWTGDVKNQEDNIKIGKTLKERLKLPARCNLGYEAHVDTQSKTSSSVKVRFQI